MAYTISMPSPSSQFGGIFTYILIGIVLFAALGYAISRNHIKTDFVTDEKAKLHATEIINFGDLLRTSVSKLRLRGCKENQLELSTSLYVLNNGSTSNTTNSNAPSDGSCALFSSTGAGVTPYIIPAPAQGTGVNMLTAVKLGSGTFGVRQILQVGTDGVNGTTSANELIFSFVDLNKKVCLAINNLLGVTNPGGEPPTQFTTGSGSYTNGSFTGNTIMNETNIVGKKAFCSLYTANRYHFYQSVLDR